MIARYGVKDSPAGFPPFPQAGRRSFCDPCGKRLPSIFQNGRKEGLQGGVVIDAGLRTKNRTPRRGRFPETPPMCRVTGGGLIATNPSTDAGIVSGIFLAGHASCGALKHVPP